MIYWWWWLLRRYFLVSEERVVTSLRVVDLILKHFPLCQITFRSRNSSNYLRITELFSFSTCRSCCTCLRNRCLKWSVQSFIFCLSCNFQSKGVKIGLEEGKWLKGPTFPPFLDKTTIKCNKGCDHVLPLTVFSLIFYPLCFMSFKRFKAIWVCFDHLQLSHFEPSFRPSLSWK